jgi:hypothetical protein
VTRNRAATVGSNQRRKEAVSPALKASLALGRFSAVSRSSCSTGPLTEDFRQWYGD